MTQSLYVKGLPDPMKIMMPFFKIFFKEDGGKSALEASRSTVFAATDPTLEGVTGRYLILNQMKKLHPSSYDDRVHKKAIDVIELTTLPSMDYPGTHRCSSTPHPPNPYKKNPNHIRTAATGAYA